MLFFETTVGIIASVTVVFIAALISYFTGLYNFGSAPWPFRSKNGVKEKRRRSRAEPKEQVPEVDREGIPYQTSGRACLHDLPFPSTDRLGFDQDQSVCDDATIPSNSSLASPRTSNCDLKMFLSAPDLRQLPSSSRKNELEGQNFRDDQREVEKETTVIFPSPADLARKQEEQIFRFDPRSYSESLIFGSDSDNTLPESLTETFFSGDAEEMAALEDLLAEFDIPTYYQFEDHVQPPPTARMSARSTKSRKSSLHSDFSTFESASTISFSCTPLSEVSVKAKEVFDLIRKNRSMANKQHDRDTISQTATRASSMMETGTRASSMMETGTRASSMMDTETRASSIIMEEDEEDGAA